MKEITGEKDAGKRSVILKNLVSVTAGQFFSGTLYLASVALIARYLNPERFGDFSYIVAYVNIFQFIADLGIASIFIREVSREKTRLGHFFGNLKALYWIFSLFSSLIIVLSIRITTDDPVVQRAAYPAAVATIALFHVFSYAIVFRAFEHMEINSAGLVLSRLCFLLLVLGVIRLERGLFDIFAALALSSIILWLLYYIIVRKRYIRPRLSFDFPTWRYFIKEGLSTGGTIMMRKTLWYADIFMLKALATSAAVGLFNSIYQIVQMVYLIPWTVAVPFYPVFSRLSKTDPRLLHRMLNNILKIVWLITLPLCIWTTFASDEVITIIYGEKFSSAAVGLKLIIWTIPFLFPTSIFFFFFTAVEKQRSYFVCVLIAFLLKVVCNVLLIPKIGYLAACWATIISDFCHYWLSMILLKKIGFPINNARLIGVPALGGLLSALCLLPTQWYHSAVSTVFFTGSAAVAYAGILFISKYIRKADILLLLHPAKAGSRQE